MLVVHHRPIWTIYECRSILRHILGEITSLIAEQLLVVVLSYRQEE
jgi:hypothetical protein